MPQINALVFTELNLVSLAKFLRFISL